MFVLAALLPTVLLAAVTYWRVERELRAEARAIAHAHTKQLGMGLLQQLSALNDILVGVGMLAGRAPANAAVTPVAPVAIAAFDGVMLEAGDGSMTVLSGERFAVPPADERGAARLRRDEPLLLVGDANAYLLQRLPDMGTTVIGRLPLARLLDEQQDERLLACVLPAGHAPHCDGTVPADWIARVGAAAAARPAGGFEAPRAGEPYYVRYWSLFLDGEFGTPPWVAMVANRRDRQFAGAAAFQRDYALVVLASLLTVVWLSLGRIRRLTDRIRRLTAGTRRLAEGDFGSRVTLDTADELADLADSFNGMAGGLQQSFTRLRLLGEIDRAILDTRELAPLMQALVARAGPLTGADWVGLIAVEAAGHRFYLADGTSRPAPPDWCERLAALREPTLLAGMEVATLGAQAEAGLPLQTLALQPIRVDGRPAAVLCCGWGQPPGDAAALTGALDDLARRLAVALEAVSHEAELRRQARTDPLTGLPNRRLLQEHLEADLARAAATGTAVAVMFIDLDRFKQVNDALGHAFGDRVLVTVAGWLASLQRPGETLARFGGDEYVMIIPSPAVESERAACQTARRIVAELTRDLVVDGRRIEVAASVGISLFPRDGQTAADLLRRADIAMYRAKANGRNRAQLYAGDADRQFERRLELETALRAAILHDTLEVHYQPKVDSRTGVVVGAEALVRWTPPGGAPLSPATFIPIAEETGLIRDLGPQVFRRACRDLAGWLADGLPALRVSVNVSPAQMCDPRLATGFLQTLREFGLPPDLLEVEITESGYLQNAEQAIRILSEFRAAGMHVSVDDFGTGHSSLSYLARLPVTTLKIDRAFVHDLGASRENDAVAAAIVGLAHALDLHVVAEGAEQAQHVAALADLGCYVIQGYFYARPMPAADFSAWLRARQDAPVAAPARRGDAQ